MRRLSAADKIIALGLLLVFVGAAVATSFIPWQEADLYFTEHTVNAGELVSGVVVGQTFVARRDNLSGIAVKFATYSNRPNTHPVEFHLRASVEAAADERVAVVYPWQLRDNQLYRFTFEPIPESSRKTYFWYAVSPQGDEGNAVTIDLDTRDPYHEGSAYIVRGASGADFDAALVKRSGKQTADVVFATYHTTSVRRAITNAAQQFARTVIGTWDERQDTYLLWLELFAPVLTFCLLMIGLRGDGEAARVLPRTVSGGLLLFIFVGALLFRGLYATALPITNDEGNYLYDARTLMRGVLAGGDGYVKAPLVIAWAAVWQFLMGNTILAGRLSMIVASALITIPLYFIGKAAVSQRAGLLAAAAWAFMGAPVVFGIYLHTQSLALLFGVAGIAVLWTGLRREEPQSRWFIVSGALLGLGVASRKSVLALGLVPLLLVLVESWSWPERIRRLLMIGLSFGFVIGIFLAGTMALYGCEDLLFIIHDGGRCVAVEEALGISSAEDGLAATPAEEEEKVRAYSLRGMTPFFREAPPLILLSLVGWGIVLETTVRQALRRLRHLPRNKRLLALIDHALPKLVWAAPAAALWWAWSFFGEYEGSVFHELGGMGKLWYAIAALVLIVALWPRPAGERLSGELAAVTRYTKKSRQPINFISDQSTIKEKLWPAERQVELRTLLTASLLPPLWLAGLVFFYLNWIKFHANYLVEFLPPLAFLSGAGAYLAWLRLRGSVAFETKHPGWNAGQRLVAGAFIGIVAWSLYLSNYVTYTFPHTGTFDQRSVREAALWAQVHIPSDQAIFTGAAVVPYLSGHRVALDIAHPRWYAYEFTRTDRARLTTFLPSVEEMLAAYRQAEWFLLEQQTRFSFLMEYSEIETGLARDWQKVHEVENLSNPFKFYRRVR